uniref:Uncharacterized protein n=1 Tax=Glossina austeni TaxID=7395 RepID=A0A1A9VTP3_GLOAU
MTVGCAKLPLEILKIYGCSSTSNPTKTLTLLVNLNLTKQVKELCHANHYSISCGHNSPPNVVWTFLFRKSNVTKQILKMEEVRETQQQQQQQQRTKASKAASFIE